MPKQQQSLFGSPPPLKLGPASRSDQPTSQQSWPKRNTMCWKILEALRNGGSTNFQLATITPRYGARIHDLRENGYNIVTTVKEDSLVEYRIEE